MSTELRDLKGGMSNCCGAQVYLDQMICSDCKEHCDLEPEEEETVKEPPDVPLEEQDEIQEDTTSMEEKLEALNN